MPARWSRAARCARCWRGRAIPTRWACATPSPTCCRTRWSWCRSTAARPTCASRRPAAASRRAARSSQPACTTGPARRRRRPTTTSSACLPRRRGRHPPHRRTGSRDMAALVELRDVVKHFPRLALAGRDRRAAGTRPCTRSTASSFDIGAGDAVGHRGRIGLRQDHARPAAAEAHRADRAAPSPSTARRWPACAASDLRAFRRQAQLVFQNPFDALNPRFTIYRAVAEPLVNAGIDKAEHADRVARGLPPRPPARPRALSRPLPAPAERRPAAARRAGARAGARRRASWSPTSRCRCSMSACAPASSP